MVKQIKGPSDHVVVVGAGYAGLSAALRLAGAGRKVTIIERESVPGGRSGLLQRDGYSFDTGPSVLTMPSLINDAFNCVGEELKDWVELMPLTPLYRAFYDDGSQIDVHANTDQMEAEIARTVSSSEAAGYRRYVEFVTKRSSLAKGLLLPGHVCRCQPATSASNLCRNRIYGFS